MTCHAKARGPHESVGARRRLRVVGDTSDGVVLAAAFRPTLFHTTRRVALQNHDTSHFTLSPDVSASIHDRGVVFLHLKHGRLFSANAAGAHIWEGLQQQLSADHIAEHVSRRYQIAPDTAQAHTARFLSQLEERQIIERRRA